MSVLEVIVTLGLVAVLIVGGAWLWMRFHQGTGPPPPPGGMSGSNG